LSSRTLGGLRHLIGSLPVSSDTTRGLILALLTGDRSGLTAEQTAAFRASGASHILALSGLHLGVIYLIVSRLLSVLGNSIPARRVRSVLTILLAGWYTLATGAGPSIVRAFLFILIHETCAMFPERRTSPVRTLLMALTIQLALAPHVITSLGFQLSYLAMTGLVVLYPRLAAWYPADDDSPHHNYSDSNRSAPSPSFAFSASLNTSIISSATSIGHTNSPDPASPTGSAYPTNPDDSASVLITKAWDRTAGRILRRIWQGTALAVSCQIFTAPLVWIRFHSFPKYFILTNLLALPLTSALMAVSVAALALQGLGGCPPLLASAVDLLASTLLFVLDVISSL
jgi:ComEC/Rec2-related protein